MFPVYAVSTPQSVIAVTGGEPSAYLPGRRLRGTRASTPAIGLPRDRNSGRNASGCEPQADANRKRMRTASGCEPQADANRKRMRTARMRTASGCEPQADSNRKRMRTASGCEPQAVRGRPRTSRVRRVAVRGRPRPQLILRPRPPHPALGSVDHHLVRHPPRAAQPVLVHRARADRVRPRAWWPASGTTCSAPAPSEWSSWRTPSRSRSTS